MASNITLGQFFPGNSFIHKLDPRVKIISLVVLLIAVFLSTNYLALAINLISAIIFAVMTKISAKTYFKSMKFILFIVLFTSLLNVFYARGTQIFRFGPLVLTKEGLDNSIFVAMRLIILGRERNNDSILMENFWQYLSTVCLIHFCVEK